MPASTARGSHGGAEGSATVLELSAANAKLQISAPPRRDALLAELGSPTGGRLEGRLHAPIGLRSEILALSIVAELQRHFAIDSKLSTTR